MHQSDPEMGSKLANHMAHKEATAKTYYLVPQKTKTSLEASKRLSQVMRNQPAGGGENQAVAGESEQNPEEVSEEKRRVPWSADELKKIEVHFREELQSNEITLEVVRDKVQKSEQLQGMSPRRIYDKLKKQLKQKAYDGPDVSLPLPTAKEHLHDKLARLSTSTSKQPTESGGDE